MNRLSAPAALPAVPTHDRRTFLRAAGAAAFGLPALLAGLDDRQDPQDPTGSQARASELEAAIARCRREDRPLLLFVVPDDPKAVWDRRLWFGAFLNHAGAAALLEVSLCVPACATIGELRAHTGDVPVPGDAVLVVVDFAEGSAKVTPVVLALEPVPSMGGGSSLRLAAEPQLILTGIEAMSTELHRSMHVAGHTVANLADRARARLDDGQRRSLDAWLAGGPPPADDLLVRATAIVRSAATLQPDARRRATLDALLGAIDREVLRRPIAGSKWARSNGCGITLEQPDDGERQLAVRCGMGHVPELTQRFLYFLNER